MKKLHRVLFVILVFTALIVANCAKKDSGSGTTYSFSASAKNKISSSTLSALKLSPEASTCSSWFCLTPAKLTGKYFAAGLLIQSNGNGMSAYFGNSDWSSIKGTSTTYDFDMSTPVTNAGTLTCCSGTGDLSSSNTYYSDISYMFGYLDATFTITAASGAHGAAVATHTVRFIFADDVITSSKRGDLMYKDTDSTFKWMDSTSGTLSIARPTSPVTMNASVVNWSNPWGSTGNQTIPVVYAGISNTSNQGGPVTVTESELKTEGRTFSFNFNATGLVIFPGILANQDEGMLNSIKDVLQKIHLQGLPHSTATLGKAPDTTITIAGP